MSRLRELMRTRDPTAEASQQLREIHRRDWNAASPRQTETATRSDADTLRLFSLDRRNLWDRLTRYRS